MSIKWYFSQKNYVTQEVQFYNRQIDFGHL
jgi:hypothetical protein